MVRDAEANKAEDEKRKALVEARNQAEALIHSSEKSLSEFGDKVAAEDKTAIETAIADLKSAKDGEDAEAISTKSQTLIQASMKLGEAMYKAQQAEGGEEHDGGPTKDDGVVDAEFEEVHDEKKSA
jgi:molecular chaperone DnaK